MPSVTAWREKTIAYLHAIRNIVLSVGVNMKDGSQEFLVGKTDAEKAIIKGQLDWLHRRKIDMADVVIILQTTGEPLGHSTQEEKEYAERRGKRVEVRAVPAAQ